MTRGIRYILVLILLWPVFQMEAQVKNCALLFETEGTVDCGKLPQLDNIESYSLQFWFQPSEWKEGGILISRGDDFSVRLGKNETIIFNNGLNSLTAESPDFVRGEWNQVTLICKDGEAEILVNGKETAKGELGKIGESDAQLMLGGNYRGKIDEVRVWKATLNDEMKLFDYFTNNTLNKYCPMWEDLVVYYKIDQEKCPQLVDYKALERQDYESDNHGTLSKGVTKVEANNPKMPYLINAAYTESRRALDPEISKEQYLLSNQLIILGADAYADGHIEERMPNNHSELRDFYKGREGVKVFMAVAGTYRVREEFGDWRELLHYPERRERFAEDLAKLSEPYDGVELDLEWIENPEEWELFGKLAEDIRARLPEDKEFRISLHNYYCDFPKKQQEMVDGFTFQQYGPAARNFSYEEFLKNVEKFKQNFDRDKIMTSYSTTSSKGDKGSGVKMTKWGLMEGYQRNDKDTDEYKEGDETWNFAGPMQVYRRAKHTRDQNLQGIFYWDMSGDLRETDGSPSQWNHAKYASYGINANNDQKVEKIDVKHHR